MSLSNVIQKGSVFSPYSAEIVSKPLNYIHTQESVLRVTYRPCVVFCDLKLLKVLHIECVILQSIPL